MSEISIDPLLYMVVSVPNTDNSNNIQYYQVYTVYAKTNMAGSQIVCPEYTVNLGGALSDLVA